MWVLTGAATLVHADTDKPSAVIDPIRLSGVPPVANKVFKHECGACHFAYPPGLLPAKTWEKILTVEALSNHFGDNAESNEETVKILRDYAVANAADKSKNTRSIRIMRAVAAGGTPKRITEVLYIKRKHHHIPAEMITGNTDVEFFSHCDACHTRAEEGIFDADTVDIPNYPHW